MARRQPQDEEYFERGSSMLRRVHELYGLPFGRRQALAFDAAVRSIRAGRRATPPPLARGWNTASFERVAQTERRRIERGKPTPQIRDGRPSGSSLTEENIPF
jgi:hypothetical protein